MADEANNAQATIRHQARELAILFREYVDVFVWARKNHVVIVFYDDFTCEYAKILDNNEFQIINPEYSRSLMAHNNSDGIHFAVGKDE